MPPSVLVGSALESILPFRIFPLIFLIFQMSSTPDMLAVHAKMRIL